MPLDLIDFEEKGKEAVRYFWQTREKAGTDQKERGTTDQGERGRVTSGKNMDEFASLVVEVVRANGLPHAQIYRETGLLTLPGYFRPTKRWDLVVMNEGRLVAAVEFKSHVGPSFGNNFNNRTEEAIGTSHDFWTAFRDGAFGRQNKPFVGWLMHVEDAPESRKVVADRSKHFAVFPEFQSASYLARYEILCRKLMQEQLYSAASLIASTREAIATGEFSTLSESTSLKSFLAILAGHVAAEETITRSE